MFYVGDVLTVGIYEIRNNLNNKVYVGKSINIENRFIHHKYLLNKDSFDKNCNRHLFNSVKKYGIDNFSFNIIEDLSLNYTEEILADREFFWMLELKSTDRKFGYNLRMDSSTLCIIHEESRILQSLRCGELNPNYGNNWTDEQKARASMIQKDRHASGVYGEEWRLKISEASSRMWSDESKKDRMAKKVSDSVSRYRFYQYSKDGVLVEKYESISELISKNPDFHVQSIYSVCGGYKKSYKGFVFKKELKS